MLESLRIIRRVVICEITDLIEWVGQHALADGIRIKHDSEAPSDDGPFCSVWVTHRA